MNIKAIMAKSQEVKVWCQVAAQSIPGGKSNAMATTWLYTSEGKSLNLLPQQLPSRLPCQGMGPQLHPEFSPIVEHTTTEVKVHKQITGHREKIYI